MAALPWILMPSNSTHHELAQALFRDHGMEPSRLIEADQESVIANLVVSGVGLSLLPENLALELQKTGDVCIAENTVLNAALWFIYLKERAQDPLVLTQRPSPQHRQRQQAVIRYLDRLRGQQHGGLGFDHWRRRGGRVHAAIVRALHGVAEKLAK